MKILGLDKNSPLYITISAERFKFFIELRDHQIIEGDAWEQYNTRAEVFIPTEITAESLANFNRLINLTHEQLCLEVTELSKIA